MGAEVTVVKAKSMAADTDGMGVRAGFRRIHPTPSTPSIYRYISAFRRPTAAEVGRDE